MKKIAVVSWNSINNAGDEILGTITENLIKEQIDAQVVQVQLYPQYKDFTGMGIFVEPIVADGMLGIAKYICRGHGNSEYLMRNKAYRIRLTKYYNNMFRDVDAIIYAVGMLKFASQNQSFFFDIINRIARRKNIPVVVSGVSVAKADKEDWRFRQLVKALNNSTVKLITTRDGEQGLDILRKNYVKRDDIKIKSIGDPALLLKNYYPVPEKKENGKYVGLGLIREDVFSNYNQELTSEALTKIYLGIIKYLEKNNINWTLFCNGMESDYAFGKKLIKLAKLPESKILRNPTCAKELISDISQFDYVIAARLHACIVSTALGKPVTGFCWEDKIRCFARESGQYDFFLEPEELTAKNVIKNFNRLLRGEKKPAEVSALTAATVDSFKMIGEIIENNET